MRHRPVKLILIAASGLAITALSPVSAAVFTVSIAMGWLLRDRGRRGHTVLILGHLLAIAALRSVGIGIGLGALLLQQLVWVGLDDRRHVGLIDYVLSLVFLPRALAGPVWADLSRVRTAMDPTGWRLVFLGLFEKLVIADSFAWVADPIFDGHGPVGLFPAATGLIAFAVQVLFDLAALYHLAGGLGRILGFPLPDGPGRPFSAPTPGGFWTAWHPSLARTLRSPIGLVLWHSLGPMLALAALTQVAWIGLGSRLVGRFPRAVRLATPLLALHGLMLARSPSLQRAVFLQDGLLGQFGLGPIDGGPLLALLIGVMLLGIGPLRETWVFSTQTPSRPLARVGMGLGIAAIMACISQARPFLYPSF